MAGRWSKLKKQIQGIVHEKVPLYILCTDVRQASGSGFFNSIGIYQVRLGKSVVWNFPRQFVTEAFVYPDGGDALSYSVSDINDVVRDYLDTPKEALPEKRFPGDRFGLTEILKAADRRVGRRRLLSYFRDNVDPVILDILSLRLGADKRGG